MCRVVSGKVLDDPLIRDNHQSGVCRMGSRKVLDDPLICVDRQSGMCHMVLGKVPNNLWWPKTLGCWKFFEMVKVFSISLDKHGIWRDAL